MFASNKFEYKIKNNVEQPNNKYTREVEWFIDYIIFNKNYLKKH